MDGNRVPSRGSRGRALAAAVHPARGMNPITFEDLARALARDGAAGACLAEARALDVRAPLEPPDRGDALARAARGLRIAARLLEQLEPSVLVPPFRPVGLRGAIAAGHVALAARRPGQAEAIGNGAAEAAPDSPGGLRLVGQSLFAQRRFGLAVRALRGALAAAPSDPFTRALHAEALWFAGERVAARCAVALLRDPGGRVDPFVAALDAAFRGGALARAGRLEGSR